jgi:amidase
MIVDDGIVRPTPAVARVLAETRASLEAQGHKVVEWTPPDIRAGVALHKRFLLADGGVRIGSALKNGPKPEPWPLQLRTFEKVYKRLKAGNAPPTVSGLWEMQAEKQRYLRRMLDAWAATREVSDTGRPFDGVISPVCAFPSTPRYTFRHAGYAGIWNLADCTSVAFPAGKAKKTDVADDVRTVLRNDDEKGVWAKCE